MHKIIWVGRAAITTNENKILIQLIIRYKKDTKTSERNSHFMSYLYRAGFHTGFFVWVGKWMAHKVRCKILLLIPISIEFSNNFCSYMLWSLTTSKSGHQKGCQFVSTYLKSVKICNTHFYFISTLLLDHVLLKMDNRKFFCYQRT